MYFISFFTRSCWNYFKNDYSSHIIRNHDIIFSIPMTVLLTYCDVYDVRSLVDNILLQIYLRHVWCCKIQSTERYSLVLATHGMRTCVRFISGLFSRIHGLMLRVICGRRLPLEARVYVWFIRYVIKRIGNLIITSNKGYRNLSIVAEPVTTG